MDERLLDHYNNELRHLRETAAEFAREFPKIAERLAMDKDAKEICPDPYVERLLEGFAYLAARIHLKLDAEFPRFTQSLLETVYPHYLPPIPSMAVVRFDPEENDGALAEGVVIPRGTLLRSNLGKGERTACTFQTAQAVRLLPLRITEARYFTRDLIQLNLPPEVPAKAALRVRLRPRSPFPSRTSKSIPSFSSCAARMISRAGFTSKFSRAKPPSCSRRPSKKARPSRCCLPPVWDKSASTPTRRSCRRSPAVLKVIGCCASISPFRNGSVSSSWRTSATLCKISRAASSTWSFR